MLNTFFHRSCDEYLVSGDPSATCQTAFDLVAIFVAAVGAGVAFADERVALIGFLGAHVLATVLFIVFLEVPAFVVGDPVLVDAIITRSFAVAVKYEFPFALIISFVGSMLGVFLEERVVGMWDRSRL